MRRRKFRAEEGDESNCSTTTTPLLALSAAAAGGVVLLACRLDGRGPLMIDRRIRRAAHAARGDVAARALAPLFVLGLPGGYLAIAGVAAHQVRRRGGGGASAIVASALLGWVGHRAIKLGARRERPRIVGRAPRPDSFPSGHTTGATALAVTAAVVLERAGVIDVRAARRLALGAPFLVGVYRVLDDEHWASDVAGGWLLGAAIAASCLALTRRGGRANRY